MFEVVGDEPIYPNPEPEKNSDRIPGHLYPGDEGYDEELRRQVNHIYDKVEGGYH